MALRVGSLGEQVLLLGRVHIVGQAGRPEPVKPWPHTIPTGQYAARVEAEKAARSGAGGCPGVPVAVPVFKPAYKTETVKQTTKSPLGRLRVNQGRGRGRGRPMPKYAPAPIGPVPKASYDYSAPVPKLGRLRTDYRDIIGPPAMGESPGLYAPRAKTKEKMVAIAGTPFVFPASRTDPVSFRMTHAMWESNPALREYAQWIAGQAIKQSMHVDSGGIGGGSIVATCRFKSTVTDGHRYSNPDRISAESARTCFPLARRDVRRDDGYYEWHRILIYPGDVLDARYLDGSLPLAKFDHPVTLKPWGMFFTWSEYATITVEFRPVPTSSFNLWEALGLSWLWGAVKTVAAAIKEFVGDILNFLKGFLCASTKSYMQKLADMADGKIPRSAELEASMAAVGVTSATLSVLQSGATQAAIDGIVKQLNSVLCPAAPDIPSPTAKSGVGTAIVVGAVVGVPLVYYLLKIR